MVNISVAAIQSKDLARGEEGLGRLVRQRLGEGLGGNCDDGCNDQFLHLEFGCLILFCFVL